MSTPSSFANLKAIDTVGTHSSERTVAVLMTLPNGAQVMVKKDPKFANLRAIDSVGTHSREDRKLERRTLTDGTRITVKMKPTTEASQVVLTTNDEQK